MFNVFWTEYFTGFDLLELCRVTGPPCWDVIHLENYEASVVSRDVFVHFGSDKAVEEASVFIVSASKLSKDALQSWHLKCNPLKLRKILKMLIITG